MSVRSFVQTPSIFLTNYKRKNYDEKFSQILSVSVLCNFLSVRVSLARTAEVNKLNLDQMSSTKLQILKKDLVCCLAAIKKGNVNLELVDPCTSLTAADQARTDDADANLSAAYKESSRKQSDVAFAAFVKCLEEHSKAGRNWAAIKELLKIVF